MVKDRCLAYNFWLTFSFWYRKNKDHFRCLAWTWWMDKWTVYSVHRKELPTYLLMMDNSCQDTFLQQFGMCHLSILASYIMSMDGFMLGTSEVWLWPESWRPDAYQKFLWTIQASWMSGAKRKCLPHEPSAFPVKTLTNARTGFSQISAPHQQAEWRNLLVQIERLTI